MTNFPRLLRTAPAAEHCGFKKSTFEKWRCTGEGPDFIRRGKSVFYDIEDLARWLADLPRYGSTSEADAAKHAEAKLVKPLPARVDADQRPEPTGPPDPDEPAGRAKMPGISQPVPA